ncbi:MAG: RNA 2'-phosphotransferase [Myxococcota bacterium]
MTPDAAKRKALGRHLSWLLRHGAVEAGLEMDAAGWAPLDAVLRRTGLDRAALLAEVAADDKGRLEVAGDRIRCCQGHSLAGTPVRREALEASWVRVDDRVDPLWHGTRRDAVAAIRREGLRPMDRSHVHLAGARDDRVGKRSGAQVLLCIDPEGLRAARVQLFRSPNGVFLVRAVPPACVIAVERA